MRLRLGTLLLGVVFSLMFVGCGEKGDSTVSSDKGNKVRPVKKLSLIERLDPTGVLVRVGNRDVTKSDFVLYEKLRCRAWAASKGIKWNPASDEGKRLVQNMKMRNLGELVRRAMILQYAQELGLSVDTNEVRKAERRLLASVHQPKGDFRQVFSKIMPDGVDFACEMATLDALTQQILKKTSTNSLEKVTAEEISNRVAFVQKWNIEAEGKNAAARRRAQEAKAKIVATTNFAAVAKEYAEFCPEQGESWETFNLDEFEANDPLAQWLIKAEVGDISEPFDLEDGISILGLKSKEPSAAVEEGKPVFYDYEVVRIAFYAYEKLEVIEDEKQLVKDIIDQRKSQAMLALREQLMSKYKLVFPNGNNLFHAKRSKRSAKSSATAKAKNQSKVKRKVPGEAPVRRKPRKKSLNSDEVSVQGKGEVK